jgi:hypothetical protein
MPRHFNTAGPNRSEIHYTLSALARLPELHRLVQAEAWFVLHAPRQVGKTTAMRALAEELTASGKYAALWATCEAGEPYRDDPAAAERVVIESIAASASLDLPSELRPVAADPAAAPGRRLAAYLQAWCGACPRPVVLLLDEIDALQNDALITVLRQLRGIFPHRPQGAPSTVALIGLRDVRDYKVAAGGTPHLGTASPFNVKAKSMTMAGFTASDVAALYGQHTGETGQEFAPEALELAFEVTQGQPWLVNALADQVVNEIKVTGRIEAAHIARAKELLILSRSTHLDSLADKLNEPRVRSVIAPMISGEPAEAANPRDVDYCVDLGLLRKGRGGLEIANPIYREVLPRELAVATDYSMPHTDRMAARRKWGLPDGRLDIRGLLETFVDFWRQHGEWMVRQQQWPEFAHQLVVMAFLQRLVNGGGYIDREYGLGRKRLDLMVRWFTGLDPAGLPSGEDRHALELKVWRDGQKDPLAQGLTQIDGYLQRLGLATGTLLLFDARSAAPAGDDWETRGEFTEAPTPSGRIVTVLRL